MLNLDFKKSGGLIPAIAQDYKTGDVLMLAYINEESWNETLKSGVATYWSRSRNKLWKKGEESGNTQVIKEILVRSAAPHVMKDTAPVSSADWKRTASLP